MDEKILNSLLDYAREYMGAEIPFNNKWIIENFLIAERIKLSKQQSNCNLPHVSNNEVAVCYACGSERTIILKKCGKCGNTIDIIEAN